MEQFAGYAAELGWQLTKEQLNQFVLYETLLMEWNQRMNLTAIREPELIRQRHFFDSLSCATVTKDLNGLALADVGTGAGFPGVPLKILYPQLRLTLIESVAKKTQFLTAVVAALGLSDVNILAERVEVLGQQVLHRGQYDWVVARGVAKLRVLVEYLLPLCRIGGHVLAQKGDNAAAEMEDAAAAIATLGGASPILQSIQMPNRAKDHYLVLIEKVNESPARYPRRVGIPAKRPL